MDTQTITPEMGVAQAVQAGEIVSHEATPAPAMQQPQAQSDMLMAAIMQMSSPGSDVDLDRMERLFTMHERISSKEAEARFDQAMSAARGEVDRILPNQKNNHAKSEYADLDAINAKLVPALAQHGLHVSARPERPTKDGWVALVLTIKGHGHKQESYIEGPADGAGSGGKTNKTGIQAIGSSYTYLMRYSVRLAFNLAAAKDDDGNYGQQQAQVMPADMVNKITDLLISTGTRLQAFLGNYKAQSIPDLDPDQARDAISKLEAKAAKKGGDA